MKVVHIATTLSGGAGIATERIHDALLASGIDSRVLCARRADNAGPEIALIPRRPQTLAIRLARKLRLYRSREEKLLVQLDTLNATARSVQYELFSLPFSLLTAESHPWVKEADIINLHWVAGALDWRQFFSLCTKPVVFTLHDQQTYLGGFHYERDASSNPHLSNLEQEMRELKSAALGTRPVGAIANSEWNAREAKASGFFKSGTQINTILYPLDSSVYHPFPKEDARARAGIPTGRLVIGFACENLDNQRKGFADLLQALQGIPVSWRERIALLSFGQAPNEINRQRIDIPWIHLGLLHGDIAKANVYSAMDIFVVPSREEAFGQTAIEALACGVTVIGSRVGGLVEALDGGSCGALVEPACPDELRSIMLALLDDPPRRAVLAIAGRARVALAHNPARQAEAHRRFYEQRLETIGSSKSATTQI